MKRNAFVNILIPFFACGISVVGVFLTSVLHEYNGRGWLVDFLTARRLSCFICWEVLCALFVLWQKKIRRVSLAAGIPAVLFSVISVAEGCLIDNVTLHCLSIKALILAFFGCMFLYVLLLELLYWGIDRILSSARERYQLKEMQNNNVHGCSRMFLYGLCIMILWSPWMVMCFPGNMNYDTGTSILFHLGFDRSNVNNPFFQNFIFGMVYRFGCLLGNVDLGMFLYVLCQSMLWAVLLGKSLSHLENMGAPRAWIMSLLALYSFCPYFPVYAITIGKDSNFTAAVLAFTTLLMLYMSRGENFLEDQKKLLTLSALVILMGLLKNHGTWIGIGCLTVSGIRYIKQRKSLMKPLCKAVTVILIVTSFLPSALGVPKTMTRESMSLPLQQTARYVLEHADEVTEEEREAIDAVVPYKLLSKYNPVRADPVKASVREDVSKREWSAYFRVWLKQLFLHPKTYLEAFYFQTYGYYSTDAMAGAFPMRKWGYDIDGNIFAVTEMKPTHDVEKLSLAIDIDEWAMNIPLLGKLQRIGIYTWILVASIAYLLSRKKNWWLICLLPSIIIMAGCCLTAVNGYPRYALSAAVMIPIMSSCALFASNVEQLQD